MENPLMSNPEAEPEAPKAPEVPASVETPVAAEAPAKPAKEVKKEKKTFFTTGKIIAIFAALIVIAAIVGAIIYSQSSEQFQGATFRMTSAPAADDIVPLVVESQPLTIFTGISCPPELGLTVYDDQGTDVCRCAIGTPYPPIWDPIDLTWAVDPALHEAPCVCPTGQIIDVEQGKCIVPPLTVTSIPATFMLDEDEPEDDPGVGIVTTRPGVHLTLPDISQDPVVTCESATANLIEAYNNRNWDAYEGALTSLIDLNCLQECKSKIYWIIFYLNTNATDQARATFDEFRKSCGSDCEQYLDLLLIIIDYMSEKDLRAQTTFTHVVPGLSDADIDFLKYVLEGYIENCQCIEVEQLVANPGSVIEEYFPSTSTENPFTNRVTQFEDGDKLTIAYAQSVSPTIQSALEEVIDEECPPEDTPTPKVCRSLTIVEPTDANQQGTPTVEISADGYVDETIRVTLDADEGSYANLLYTSDNGNITFDDQGTLSTTSLSALMDGAPPEGVEELVTVWARQVDDAGNYTGIDSCHDAFIVKLEPVVVGDDDDDDDDEPPSLTYIPPTEDVPDDDEPPSLTYVPPTEDVPEDDEPPTITYVPPVEDVPDVPTTVTYVTTTTPSVPAPQYVVQTPATTTVAPAPIHAAAPATPQTGPGLIIPLIGTALGGAWFNRRRKK